MHIKDVLNLPIHLFWCLSRHIDRIKADNDLRLFDLSLMVASASNGADKSSIEEYRSTLLEQRGEVVRETPVFSSKDDILKLSALSQM